jgi:hypothetical protein
MASQFGMRFRLPRKSQGSFKCRKSATWDRRFYFPSEGRHAMDFFARKIRSNPRTWVPEASMLTTRPPKPLTDRLTKYPINRLTPWSRIFLRSYRSSTGEEIPSILSKLEVHFRIYKCRPPAPILSQINPVLASQFHFLRIHCDNILPSTPGCSKWNGIFVTRINACRDYLGNGAFLVSYAVYVRHANAILFVPVSCLCVER